MSKKYYGSPEAVKAYKRERARISKQISSMRKRGYLVPDEVLPSVPKKITQGSVRRLKAITLKALYEQSEYIEQSTGEIIEGKRGRYYERKIASAKANATKQKNKLAEVIADGKIDLSDLVNLTDLIETPDEDKPDDYNFIEDYDNENNWNDYSNIDVDPIERIRDRIQALPTIFHATMNGYRVTLDKRDAFLRINEIFEKRVSEFGDNFQEVVDYCNSIVSEIDSIADDIINAPSDLENINTQYARLMELIKGIPLSKDERTDAGELSDTTDDWEDEDYNEW